MSEAPERLTCTLTRENVYATLSQGAADYVGVKKSEIICLRSGAHQLRFHRPHYIIYMIPAFIVVPICFGLHQCGNVPSAHFRSLAIGFCVASAAYNLWDHASHLILFGSIHIWVHSYGNFIVACHAFFGLAGPLGLRRLRSPLEHAILAAVVAQVYSALMQAANVIWSLESLCSLPIEQSLAPGFWFQSGVMLQGPTLLYLAASATFVALDDQERPRKLLAQGNGFESL